MKPPIFRPAAAADVENAYQWYEDRRVGLGDEFLAAVSAIVESLATSPERFLLFIVRRVVQICLGFRIVSSTELLTIKS